VTESLLRLKQFPRLRFEMFKQISATATPITRNGQWANGCDPARLFQKQLEARIAPTPTAKHLEESVSPPHPARRWSAALRPRLATLISSANDRLLLLPSIRDAHRP